MTVREGGGKHYSTDGEGNWSVLEHALRCPHAAGFLSSAQCQGKLGHSGPHWRFDERGWLDQTDNARETDRGCSYSTPPGHKDYKSPAEMAEFYHGNHGEWQEVTDQDLIAKLESDEELDGDASVTRPLDEEGSQYYNDLRAAEKRLHSLLYPESMYVDWSNANEDVWQDVVMCLRFLIREDQHDEEEGSGNSQES